MKMLEINVDKKKVLKQDKSERCLPVMLAGESQDRQVIKERLDGGI